MPERDRPRQVDIGITLGKPGRFDDESPAQWKEWLKAALPDERVDRGVAFLIEQGFEVLGRSRFTLTLRATPELFERFFSSKVTCRRLPSKPGSPAVFECGLAEGATVTIPERLRDVVGRVTVQPATRLLASVSASPPDVRGVHYLKVDEVAGLLRATKAHEAGITGAGVRLTMIDTEFDHEHPFFVSRNVRSTVVTAGGAAGAGVNGHGTGCSANVFAVAPGVEFTGIEVGALGGSDGGAPLLAGFQRALGFDPRHPDRRVGGAARPLPQIISVSLSCGEAAGTVPPWQILPAELGELETCVQEALAEDIVVVVAAGNLGERGFPAQMRPVIAAGGVFSDKQGVLHASDFASAFTSRLYPNRKVPDLCGLCGEGQHADYIMLPVPSGSEHDRECGVFDGTTKKDGWARFSGTSAAAPQLAGVCALLLQQDPGLTPQRLKKRLLETAIDVDRGAAADMGAPGGGLAAQAGRDRATGAGLVDAAAALGLA